MPSLFRATALAALGALPMTAHAQVGTLIVAHGGGPAWNAGVHEVAAQVRTGGPVEVSFLMGPGAAANPFQVAARRLVEAGARGIVVVPLLVSSHSGHYDQIRWLAGQTDEIDAVMQHHLHLGGIERPDLDVPIAVAKGLDDAPELAGVLAERALAVADPEGRALLLVGHGPNSAEDHALWMANLREVADVVKARTGFRDVKVGLIRDDAGEAVRAEAVRSIRDMIELQHELTGRSVVVVPVLVSRGSVSEVKIPRDLAGLPVEYTGDALLPHPGLARWIESRVRSADAAAVLSRGTT